MGWSAPHVLCTWRRSRRSRSVFQTTVGSWTSCNSNWRTHTLDSASSPDEQLQIASRLQDGKCEVMTLTLLNPLPRLKYVSVTALLIGMTYLLATLQPSTITLAITQGVEGIALKKIAQEFSTGKNIFVQVKEF